MIIYPAKLHGDVHIPPSKSMAHRAVICAALAKGKSIIRNIDYSDDIRATINAMRALGAEITGEGPCLSIDGRSTFSAGGCTIACGESGSTLRFMIPLSLLKAEPSTFLGAHRLGERPLDPYFDLCARQKIAFQKGSGGLNLTLEGLLQPDTFIVKGDISSQFVSGLCFALPLLKGDSLIRIEGSLESRAYVDMTLQMLELFGIEVTNIDYREFYIKGGQSYRPREYTVEADFSQSAFFFVMGALGGGITLRGLSPDSLQGDKAVVPILQSMGASIAWNGSAYTVEPSGLKGTLIDASSCPDIIPVLSMAAACAQGRTEVTHAKRLRIKECDRLSAVSTELNKIGGRITELPEGLIIEGTSRLKGGAVSAWGDHRIAMSLASISPGCSEPLILDNPECTAKSFPRFWEVFASLGGHTS